MISKPLAEFGKQSTNATNPNHNHYTVSFTNRLDDRLEKIVLEALVEFSTRIWFSHVPSYSYGL